MSLHFIDGDITKLKTDAIVNAANNSLLGGGGVDGAIHRAAGPELLEECRRIGGLGTGKAVVTGGYALPAKYVIHTVGPVYRDGLHGEELLLRSAYRESLLKAAEISCSSLAFPVISSGAYGYPKEEAIRVAVSEISAFLLEHELEVFLVFYNESDRPSRDSAPDGLRRLLASLPDSREKARLSPPLPPENRRKEQKKAAGMAPLSAGEAARCAEKDLHFAAKADELYSFSGSIDNIGFILDESFQEMLLRLIDEKGMTDTECYKRANLDRKHFSKIRSNRLYQPKKATAAAFCIALRLSLAESEELLKKAGFALSDSTYFDRIIRYCIEHRIFDIDDVNLLLFKYDQIQLGAAVR